MEKKTITIEVPLEQAAFIKNLAEGLGKSKTGLLFRCLIEAMKEINLTIEQDSRAGEVGITAEIVQFIKNVR